MHSHAFRHNEKFEDFQGGVPGPVIPPALYLYQGWLGCIKDRTHFWRSYVALDS